MVKVLQILPFTARAFEFHLVLLLISDSFSQFWKFIFLRKWSSSLGFFFLSNIGIKLNIVFFCVFLLFLSVLRYNVSFLSVTC